MLHRDTFFFIVSAMLFFTFSFILTFMCALGGHAVKTACPVNCSVHFTILSSFTLTARWLSLTHVTHRGIHVSM